MDSALITWLEKLVYHCIGLDTVAVKGENLGPPLVQEVVLLLHEGDVPGAAQ